MADYAKIYRNLTLMAEQNAPQEDIDYYLNKESITGKQVVDWYRSTKGGTQEPSVNKPTPQARLDNEEQTESWSPNDPVSVKKSLSLKELGYPDRGDTLTPYKPTISQALGDSVYAAIDGFGNAFGVKRLSDRAQRAQDAGRSLVNAATFGFADRIRAIGDTTLEYERYLSKLAEIRNPQDTALGGIVGSVGSGFGLGKMGVTAARAVPQGLTKGKALMANMLAGGVDGVGYQALDNIGYGRDIGENTGIAALLGGTAPAVSSGVKKVGVAAGNSKLGRYLTSDRRFLSGNKAITTEQKAAQKVYDIMQELDQGAVKKQTRRLGENGLNVDLLGTKGTALARSVANINPDAREILEKALTSRSAGQNERVVADLNRAARLSRSNTQTVDNLKAGAYEKVAPSIKAAYDEAKLAGYDLPIEQFENILSTPMGKKAYKKGIEAVKNSNFNAPPAEIRNFSNLELLDHVKRSLDDNARSAYRGGASNEGSQAYNLAKALREQIDASLTDDVYAKARGLRQDAYRTDEAFDMGKQLAGGRIDLDAPQKALSVEAEKKKYLAQGYAAEQAENLLNRRNTDGSLLKMQTPQGKKAIDAALGERGLVVSNALDRENVFNRTSREVLGGSTTARQLSEMSDLDNGGILKYIPTASTATSLLRGGADMLSRKIASKKSKELAPYIAELLASSGMPKNSPIPPSALEKFIKKDKNDDLRKIIFSLMTATQRGGYQEPQ